VRPELSSQIAVRKELVLDANHYAMKTRSLKDKNLEHADKSLEKLGRNKEKYDEATRKLNTHTETLMRMLDTFDDKRKHVIKSVIESFHAHQWKWLETAADELDISKLQENHVSPTLSGVETLSVSASADMNKAAHFEQHPCENPVADDAWKAETTTGMCIDSSIILVKANFDFAGVQEGDLPFSEGDIFEAERREFDAQAHAGGWVRGRFRGRTGVFPSNYVCKL